MSSRILLTGFVPFAEYAVNPSEVVVKRLADTPLPGVVLSTRILPVSYREAFAPVRKALDEETFDAALLLGLGSGRSAIDFERMAVNWRGGSGTDNLGVRVDGEKIDPDGPAAYFSTVPAEEMVTACQGAGARAAPSAHAGTFVCNQILYQALRQCDQSNLACRVGFVHLPVLPGQGLPGQGEAPLASMEEDVMVAGLKAALVRLAGLPPPQRGDDLMPGARPRN